MGGRSSKGVSYSPDGTVESCIFCRIIAGEPVGGTRILYETDTVVAFRPRGPAAQHHFLVVPKRHIRNINAVTRKDAELLDEMRRVGLQILAFFEGVPDVDAEVRARRDAMKRHNAASSRSGAAASSRFPAGWTPPVAEPPPRVLSGALFGFHAPPFNSIDHLHLHCFLPPFRSIWAAASYTPGTVWSASFDSVTARLGVDGEARER